MHNSGRFLRPTARSSPSGHYSERGHRTSLGAPQIPIGAIEPVGPRRSKDVEIDRLHKGFRLVRHVRRYGEHLASIDHDFFTINPKLQRALENVCALLVMVAR